MIKEQYQPGVLKLIQHLDHLQKMQSSKIVAPIHVSIWPTVRCQLSCAYCCCRDEQPALDLSWGDFKNAVEVLAKYGTRAIEFAGGGEPLLWEHFSAGVELVHDLGLKISLITNGLALDIIPDSVLNRLSWLRVSIQSIDHARKIDWEGIASLTRISASYMATDTFELPRLYGFAKANDIVVRVAAPQPSKNNECIKEMVEALGEPLFFAEKPQGAPKGCYMAWIRAAIDWRGYFLPCPSVMLVPGSVGKINNAFRLCHVSGLEGWLNNNPAHDLGFKCVFCNCGKENNDLIHGLLTKVEDADFV